LFELPLELFELAAEALDGVLELVAVLLPAVKLEAVAFDAENGLAAPEPHPAINVEVMRPALNLSISWLERRNWNPGN
jgi:hypothetical protein